MKNITDYFSNPEKKGKNGNYSKTEEISQSAVLEEIVSDKKRVKSNRKTNSPTHFNSSKNTPNIVIDKNVKKQRNTIINNVAIPSNSLADKNTYYSSTNITYDEMDVSKSVTNSLDKKNAFEVMMESRNKIIGLNSPGKEFIDNEDFLRNEESKKLSVRKTLLSEWADFKGGAKRKREEEERDQIIKVKLKKRVKRMTKLLNGNKDLNDPNNLKAVSKKKKKIIKCISSSSSSDEIEQNFENKKSVSPELDQKDSSNNENLAKKMEKSEIKCNDHTLIETKLTKKHTYYNENSNTENLKTPSSKSNNGSNKENKQTPLKNHKVFEIIDESSQESLATPSSLRFWRMKIKLNMNEHDEINNANSQEKKTILIESDSDSVYSISLLSSEDGDEDYLLSDNSTSTKLAPIFIKASPKPKLDPEILKARQEFLMSGTPLTLKKKMDKQKSFEEKPFTLFPTVSHVQQKCDNPLWDLPTQNLSVREFTSYKFDSEPCHDIVNRISTKMTILQKKTEEIEDVSSVLSEIKSNSPDYPVYKSFRLINEKSEKKFFQHKQSDKAPIKRKRGRPKKSPLPIQGILETPNADFDVIKYAMWTDKYKPKSSEDIIGNNEAIKKLTTWLESWKTFSQDIISKKSRRHSSSSEFETTDCDSRDSTRLPDSAIIIGGPCGCGKSAAVYAICNQLDFTVIELNASSKRTGKKLLQDLLEATQSYQVRKGEGGIQNLFNINQQKESAETEVTKINKKMSVLLVEDIDIVFDQDDGFIIALQHLIATSKRPIILTTTDYSSSFAQKFLIEYDCISFSPLQSSSLAVWCQILCLVEGLFVDRDDIASLMDYNKGDIRKTLLQLQYWVQSGGQLNQEKFPIKIDHQKQLCDEKLVEDEVPNELLTNKKLVINNNMPKHKNCFRSFELFECDEKFCIPSCMNLGFLWWNIPHIFGMKNFSKIRINKLKIDDRTFEPKEEDIIHKTQREKEKIKTKLRHISNFYSSLSFADIIFRKVNYFDDLEPEVRNHNSSFKDSLVLEEKNDSFEDMEFIHEVTHTLLNGHIKRFNFGEMNEMNLNIGVPGRSETRWRAKHHVCEDFFRESLTPWTYVERKSSVLDYYPILRTISRSETKRAANNTKRGNRFRNYLRDLGIKCSENNVKLACKMLWESD